jgi:DNA-binding NtrC family response regulator
MGSLLHCVFDTSHKSINKIINMSQKTILLVEDDVSLRYAIESFLTQQRLYQIKSVGDFEAAKAELEKSEFDLVLSDVKMPGGSGYDLLKFIKKSWPNTAVVIMTAFGTIEHAVEAMKGGAYDFIVKPFQLSTLDTVVRAALADREDITQGAVAKDDEPQKKGEKVFITNNLKVKDLIENLKKVAASKATVLIQGESGTGKEVLAQMIHHYSPRRSKAFVAINCAALPDNLLESELFGHEKGSFTGAIQRQIGKFELSDGGSILLDEISEMSLNMQTKLLRVLQECEVYRIGGNKPIPINLRVIASTNRDLYKYMKEGHFREDLYYRINVIPIFVPPLRERGDDVLVLANYFLDEFAQSHDRARVQLDDLARHKIMTYPWFGNVRELRNAMERAILVGNFEQLGNELNANYSASRPQTPEAAAEQGDGTPSAGAANGSEMTLEEVEKKVIYETLRRCNGNRTRTAEKLGISLRTLRNKLKAFKEEDSIPAEK